MARLTKCAALYDAATDWKRRCLLSNGSVLSDASLWTAKHAAELTTFFVEKPDTSSRSFDEKLEDQLRQVSPGACQLAAEMLWVMMLFPSNISPTTKTALVRKVWEWSGAPLPDPRRALDAFANGIGSGGPGYNNYRPAELQLLVRFTAAWKALPAAEQSRLLSDAWVFADWFDRLPDATSRQLRHMLLHLLFPDEFERISSTGDKRRIDEKFANRLATFTLPAEERGPAALARDRRLRRVREVLQREKPGAQVDYYESPEIAAQWKKEKPKPSADGGDPGGDPPGKRVWVIGAGEGARRWPAFYDDGIIAIGWDDLGDIRQYATYADLHAAMKQTYERDQEPRNDSLACYEFCYEIALGDTVYVKQGRNRILGMGRVVSEYLWDDSRADYRNVRQVEWLARGNWSLPEAAQVPTKTLTEVTPFRGFRDFVESRIAEDGPEPAAPPPYGTDDLLKDAFLPRETAERILSSLQRRKNVILQGPPGVGKSFLAKRLAYALIGAEAPENVQMVQFHQSYAYEDFIQGWRPNGDGGFVLRQGVFSEFCRRAQSHLGQPYVFIIDEINRGNLSKVFGELLLLIEADKRGPGFQIPLTYAESATDTFYIPENVYLIGLMNTADRSLAMVDYALRRRFAFHNLAPAFESPAFAEMLTGRGVDAGTIARIRKQVGAVNEEIVGDHKNLGAGFAIGHSYFCPTEAVEEPSAWYETIVREELEPLLGEYWFDDAKRVQRCRHLLMG